MSRFSRRQFVRGTVVSAAASAAMAAPQAPSKGFHPASDAGRGVKVACSTAIWRKGSQAPLDQALAGIARAGFTWVEVDSDDLWDYRERPDDFKKLLDQHGLGLVTATVFGNFADRDQRLKNISRAVLTARALQALGAGILVLEGEWGNSPREPQNYHTYSSNLGEVGALVFEETGLHCGYRFREREAADVRKIIATSDSRYVKFCFDTQYLTQLDIALPPMIQAYGKRLVHVHLRDGKPAAGGWQDVPVGSGKINPDPVLAALCEARYDGWVTIQQDRVHHSAEKDAVKSLQKVQKRLEAAIAKTPNAPLASVQPSDGDDMMHQMHTARGMLGSLVMIGAAIGPAAFFAPSPAPQDKSNPMQQMTHDMHRDRNRPVTPLPPQDPNFQPLFFSADEYRDVSALADAIIPVTNTPGALAARADEYADLMTWLAQENHAAVRRETEQFRAICSRHYGKSFAELAPAQRTEFLALVTGESVAPDDRPARAFFNHVHGLAVRAYYASPQGLIEDLGYKGNTYEAEFIGCTHPEHQG